MKFVDAEGMLGIFFLFELHFSVTMPDSRPRTCSGEATSIFCEGLKELLTDWAMQGTFGMTIKSFVLTLMFSYLLIGVYFES